MVNNFLFCVCVCVLQVTWRANGIVLYMYEGNVLMDTPFLCSSINKRLRKTLITNQQALLTPNNLSGTCWERGGFGWG